VHIVDCVLQHYEHPGYMFGEEMIGGVTQATIERNTYPHKYKRVTCSFIVFILFWAFDADSCQTYCSLNLYLVC